MPPSVPPASRPRRSLDGLRDLYWNGPLAFGLLLVGTALLWSIWPQEDSQSDNPADAVLQRFSEAPLADVAPLNQVPEQERIDCLRQHDLEHHEARQPPERVGAGVGSVAAPDL